MADNKKQTLLDVDTIINKEFNIDFKGYSPLEVDRFLDFVVHDYQFFQRQISQLNDKISFYENANSQLKNKLLELDARLRIAQDNAASAKAANGSISQQEMLQRLSHLK